MCLEETLKKKKKFIIDINFSYYKEIKKEVDWLLTKDGDGR